jgi:23S rRNA (uracil1939-C5)-methyltransferase
MTTPVDREPPLASARAGGGSGGRTRSSPLAEGEEAQALIEALTDDGRGLARVGGKVVFVEGALPGETVRLRYGRRRRRYDTARLVEVLNPSPARVTPPCPYFGTCGGCALQHLAPEAQVRAKQQILSEQFRRLGGGLEPEQWLAPVTGPVWGYRRRARLGVRVVPKKGGVLVGFRERARSYITGLDACLVLEPSLSALLPALRELVAGLSAPDRLPQIEVCAGDAAAALVFRHLVPLTEADRERLRAFGARYGVQIYLQPGGPESVAPLYPERPAPLEYVLEDFGLVLAFGPTDFVQVNAAVNRAMVRQAVEWLEPAPDESVLDLFCGLGNFTLPLARRAGRVLGLEVDPGLVERARANATRNGLANAEFRQADLYALEGSGGFGDFHFDKLLIDPPRSGAMEAIKRLPEPGPRRIVYVSCFPATLARDSAYLVRSRGYRLVAAGILDMFPHTRHVESMAVFVRA